jgi:hypothetical protein
MTLAKGAKETAIVDNIKGHLACYAGGFVFKVHGGAMQKKGLPDVFWYEAGRVAALEAKRPGEVQSPMQILVEKQLRRAGVPYAVVHNWDESRRALQEAGFLKGQILPNQANADKAERAAARTKRRRPADDVQSMGP